MSRLRIILNPEREAEFRAMWANPKTRAEDICKAFLISQKAMRRLAGTFGLPRKAQPHRIDEWPQERIDLLTKLWQDGLSASQVAAQIGGVTRSAVVAKVHRLGLPKRGQDVARMNTARGARVARAVQKRQPKPRLSLAGNGTVFEVGEAPPPRVQPREKAFNPLPGVPPVLFIEREGARCKWPIDSDDGAFWCCGADTGDVTASYCATHAATSVSRTPAAKKWKASTTPRALRKWAA